MVSTKLLIDSSELLKEEEVPVLIKDKILLSPGTWNDSKYKVEEIENAYINTDWKNKSNFQLYLDHEDSVGSGVGNWVGYVKNIRVEDKTLMGDLEVWNPLVAMYLTKAKAKFGVSATLRGMENEQTHEMKDFQFESFSVVTNPACKDAFINLSQKEKEPEVLKDVSDKKDIKESNLTSNERRFKIEPKINMAEESEEKTEDTATEAQDEEKAAEPAKEEAEEAKEEMQKKKEEPEEEPKKEEEMGEDETLEMFASMSEKELSAWASYAKEMKAKYPDMNTKELAKAFKTRKNSEEAIEKLSDAELLSEISQRHEILRRRELFKHKESAEEKATRLESSVKELQEKLKEGDRKTLSASPSVQKVDESFSPERMADFITEGGRGLIQYKMNGIKTLTEQDVMNSIKMLAQATGPTISTDSRGTAITSAYGLQPILYLKSIVDGAKNQLFIANFCNTINLPAGVHQISIPKRKKYLGRDTGDDGMQIATTEPDGSDITVTTLDNLDAVQSTPTPRYAGVAITNYNLRVNPVNLLQSGKDELTYAIGDNLDREAAVTIGNATYTSDTVNGCQIIYGGDATGDSTLSTGDVITTDMVAKSARYLKQKLAYYYTGGTETLATATKNPWMPTSDEPFVLFIGPAQEETFRKDSQFVNAAEYGGNQVVMNGEIGQYLGIKIVVTNNVESVASGGTSPDDAQTAGTTTAGANMTRCILLKAKKAASIVWGQKPTLKVFDYPQRDQTWVTLVCAYSVVVVQYDAIVFLDVAD